MSDFENESILNLIDLAIDDKSYRELLSSFKSDFEKFSNLKRELNSIEKNYKELRELKDFLEFEISNIEKIKEFEPLKIGNKVVEDSGFEIQAVFNGLGLSEARSKSSTYFLGIQKGPCYDLVAQKLNLS